MSTLQHRVDLLQEATEHGSPLEELLLTEEIVFCAPHGTAHPGQNEVHKVVLASRIEAFFKPFRGQQPATCNAYSQNRDDALLHEVIAWRLAHALGEPYDQLGTTAVLRDIPDAGGPGVLLNARQGLPNLAVLPDIPKQVDSAAFWDCLIAQQDRHEANFRYDAARNRLGLIDHAFSFARPGDLMHGAVFIRQRRAEHRTKITDDEHAVLERIIEQDYFGITAFLTKDRAEAFINRVNMLTSQHVVPLPGAF